ncbi:hypothetical protein C7M52_03295 [Mixta theicola]|nr:hypothetical protein C7M52_03295 [Mixta theicola]
MKIFPAAFAIAPEKQIKDIMIRVAKRMGRSYIC